MGNQLHLNDLDRKAPARERDDGDAGSSSTAPLLSVSPEITDPSDEPPTYESSVQNPSTDYARATSPGYQSNDPATSTGVTSRFGSTCVDKATGEISCYDPMVNSDPDALYDFLLEQNAIKPQPLVRVKGSHSEKSYRHNNGHHEETTRTVVDFDIRLDFSELMMLAGSGNGQCGIMKACEPEDRALRGGIIRTRARKGPHGHGLALPIENERDVRSWVEEYCACDSSNKEFIMEKSCPGYDTSIISKRLHDLIASTNYRGSVQITFPVLNSKVIVRPSNKFTRFRYNFWVRMFFFITFLWLLSWPILFLMTLRWNVIRSVWPMAYSGSDGTRQVVLSEEDWFRHWRPAIRRALLGKRQGFVTNEDLIEIQHEAMGGRQFNTGSTVADRVLGNVFGFVDNYRTPEWGTDANNAGWH